MKKRYGLYLIPREVLEASARVLGPSSASAMALRDAGAHDGPATFVNDNGVLVVIKHPKDALYEKMEET